ncbi:MAG: ChaN family lipoprotein [Planctomycetota bacterium]
MPQSILASLVLLLVVGCASAPTKEPEPQQPPAKDPEKEPEPPVLDPTARALFDGKTGSASNVAALAEAGKDADVIAFGEIHRSPAGSKVQIELLEALAAQDRPLAVAMEFLERDTQGVLDRYLLGQMDEKDFMAWARQSKGYLTSHKPLIEFCKREGIPVIAANAPRRLVKEYRKADQSYPDFLKSLTEAERSYLPRAWFPMNEEEEERFFAAMGGQRTERNKSFPLSMALWDDAMAEACADIRNEEPNRRVLLIAGAFHVARGAQAVRKYRALRPDDSVLVLTTRIQQTEPLAYGDEDSGMGDFVLKVHAPPMPRVTVNPHATKKKSRRGPRAAGSGSSVGHGDPPWWLGKRCS